MFFFYLRLINRSSSFILSAPGAIMEQFDEDVAYDDDDDDFTELRYQIITDFTRSFLACPGFLL